MFASAQVVDRDTCVEERDDDVCVFSKPRNKAAAETASGAASFLIFLDHFESLLARISFGQK